ncbi:MAG TPA: hypothetical protein VJA25_03510, partial [Dehalococcoidia bacterium]|nr:hypothetical protein [Dehalococcoidia bacterium]
MTRYWVWCISNLIWRVLPLEVGYTCATWVADIAYLAWPRGRMWARRNAARLLGDNADEKTVDAMARQSLRNYCKYLVDFIRIPLTTAQEIKQRVLFSGWERFDEALAGGKGAIFVGLHLGNWDIAAAAIALNRYPLNVIVETFRPARLDRMVQEARARM